MQKLWPTIYALFAPLIVWGGYNSVQPIYTKHTNVDWTLIAISFVSGLAFPTIAISYAKFTGTKTFRRPTLDRSPLNWWGDTLQALRISVLVLLGNVIGGTLAFPPPDQRGLMTFYWFLSLFAGFLIGERIVYVRFRNEII